MTKSSVRHAALALAGAVLMSMPLGTALGAAATDLDCNGCVGPQDLGHDAVTTKAIKNKTITPADLAATAKPAGVERKFVPGSAVDITGHDKKAASVKLDAPADGFAFVAMSAYVEFADGGNFVGCALTTKAVYSDDEGIRVAGMHDDVTYVSPIAQTRVFKVSKGANVFNLVCSTNVLNQVLIHNASLDALYVPLKY